MATTTIYLTRDDYIDYRNVQDAQINKALDEIRASVDITNQRIDATNQRIDDTNQRIDTTNQRIGDLDRRLTGRVDALAEDVKELKVENRRNKAWLQNQFLKNPILQIQPIVILHPTDGMVEPNPKLFPRNAKEFYRLRQPTTERRRNMLRYLIQFYDISLPKRDPRSSEDESDGGSDKAASSDNGSGEESESSGSSGSDSNAQRPGQPSAAHVSSSSPAAAAADDDDDDDDDWPLARIAVDKLESIFGLSEDNFLMFMERAQERNRRAAAAAAAAAAAGERTAAKLKRAPEAAPEGEPMATKFAHIQSPQSRLTVEEILRIYEREDRKSSPDDSFKNMSYVTIGWGKSQSFGSLFGGNKKRSKHSKKSDTGGSSRHSSKKSKRRASAEQKEAAQPPSLPDRSRSEEQQQQQATDVGDSGSPTNAFTSTPDSARIRAA